MEQEIRMVDLVGQYEKIKEEVDKAILNVTGSAAFINGPEVGSFQEELERYLDVGNVIPCGNGTDALQIALMALGLEPGDEVITPDFTYVATVEVIGLLGLTPVFVDVDRETFNIDPEEVEKAISDRTKAIIPVHLYGQCANMEAIMDLAQKHDLYVVEDTAQALGSSYTFKDGTTRKAGTIGHIGCTSFFPSKNLGCFGDGGAIMTENDDLASKCRSIANHGQSQKYYHDRVGVNSRLDTIQAAVLRVKLKHLDDYNKARKKAADMYDQCLADVEGIQLPSRDPNSDHVFHQYTLRLADGLDRDEIKKELQKKGIPSMIYYPVPLHQQKAYRESGRPASSLDCSLGLVDKVISLPMHTELNESQVGHITNTLRDVVGEQKKQRTS